MLRTYTNRGRAWELVNSWWVLLTLAPFGITSFLAFLYIGFQVKQRLWQIWGWVYFAGFAAAFTMSAADFGKTAEGIGAAAAMAVWLVSFVHVFRVRPAFLIQYDVYRANAKGRSEQKISQLRQEAEAKFQATESSSRFNPPAPKKKAENDQPAPDLSADERAKDGPRGEAGTAATTLNQTGSGRRIDY